MALKGQVSRSQDLFRRRPPRCDRAPMGEPPVARFMAGLRHLVGCAPAEFSVAYVDVLMNVFLYAALGSFPVMVGSFFDQGIHDQTGLNDQSSCARCGRLNHERLARFFSRRAGGLLESS